LAFSLIERAFPLLVAASAKAEITEAANSRAPKYTTYFVQHPLAFRHHGFDITFGSLLGTIISYISFRLYHMPIRRGAGWTWGPRSTSKAWGIAVGVQGYAEEEGHQKRRYL